MCQVSGTENMKKLNNISVYSILIISIICAIVNSVIVYILCAVYLLIKNYKYLLIYLVLVLAIIGSNNIKNDFINIGIVEKKVNNYYVVDKILYKVKVTENELDIGDIIATNNSEYIEDIIYLKKNIRYETKYSTKLSNFKLRKTIYNDIQNSSNSIKDGLNKFIYNINNYDEPIYNLGYGLAIYYLIRIIAKKSNKLGILFTFLYMALFYFDIKFYLLFVDLLLPKEHNKLYLKLLIISLLNINFFHNLTILLPLLINFYYKININIDFKQYLSIIELYFFGYFNLIGIFLFKYVIYFQIVLLVASFLTLIFPFLNNIYVKLINAYSFINNINLDIRGSLSIFGIIIYYFINSIFKIKNKYLKYIIMILCILCPLNNPYTKVSYIDVGQGDSILVKDKLNSSNILIDTGSIYNYYKLKEYLYSQSIYSIDYLIITHNDSDHNGNIESLKKDFKIENIIDKPIDVSCKDLYLKNIYIDKFDNDNDNSLVYWTNINGLRFLFTGDISKSAEKVFNDKYPNLNIDILKVSHHGSKTATSLEFLENTKPRLAIISTSGMYGHPSKDTIDNLDSFLVDRYITKDDGTIEIYITSAFNLLKTHNGEFAIIKSNDIRN